MEEAIIVFQEITKLFPGVVALDRVGFSIRRGEIHAVVGQNGAGKTTLMNVLAGEIQPDSGLLLYKGQPVTIPSPHAARELGISVVHQELMLCPNLTVLENILLGRFVTRVEKEKKSEEIKEIFRNFGVDIPLQAKVRDLSVARQQLVEIARAVAFRCEVLVLDEPTSALTIAEAKHLFEILRQLVREGTTIIFISHRLEEVFAIADRITVLRDGKYVTTVARDETTPDNLVQLMIGKTIGEMLSYEPPAKDLREVVVEVRNLSRGKFFQDVSFTLCKGEILGIYGLQGSGRTELAETLFGLFPPDRGEILLLGKRIAITGTLRAIQSGFAMIPEDRRRTGLFLNMDVKENIGVVKAPRLVKRGFLSPRSFATVALPLVQKLNVKTPGLSQMVRNLSGGNQQKVVVARWLAVQPRVLIVDEMTRGIDVGAKQEMYRIIQNLRREGMSIIFISSELSEIVGLCDRVLVMYKGKIVGEVRREEISEETILAYAMGARQNLLPA
ncbi:MAG: sugar ABC transporter ATP-binding protein [Atribacterota bacterium]|nr:sugar ABC transporter ATP-binding protein [Atribacterota bacterium]